MQLLSPRARPLLAATLAITLALSTSAHAAGVPPSQATAVQREQAQTRFLRGRDLFVAKSYPEALVEFRASLDIVASPNAHLFVARCLREMGRLIEAYAEFSRTSVEATELAAQDARYAKAAESSNTERLEVEKSLAFVTVDVQHAAAGTTLKIAGEEVLRPGWREPVPVMPGTVEVVVESPSREPIRKSVTLAAGEKTAIAVDAGLQPDVAPATRMPASVTPIDRDGSPHSTMRTASYVAAGVGGAGVVTFIVFGALANSKYHQLQTECGTTCPPGKVDVIDAGRRDQFIANVGLAIGLVGIGVGVTLFVLSGPARSSEKPAGTTAALTIGPGTITLGGAF